MNRLPPAEAAPGPLARAFDALAMAVYPSLARALGVTFRVGRGPALTLDAHAVHAAVWSERGFAFPEDAGVGRRYDAATTWIVAYRGGRPVGVLGLLDPRIACIALDVERRLAPPDLDLARTRELGRLAILRAHRGGARVVMVGPLREMLAWSRREGIERLLAGSPRRSFEAFARYNPTARELAAPEAPEEDLAVTRYFAGLRRYVGGAGVLYTFDVAGASPWQVFSRFLTLRLQPGRRR